jgi:aerobic C4-dicarboxylate transport protein
MTMKTPFYKILYVQVLTAILIGLVLGLTEPAWAVAMKPLGDGFIKLVKMIIPPVIFCTVVAGISGMDDAKAVGRVGVKALIYFEIISTFALIIGLLAAHIIQPGNGFNIDLTSLNAADAKSAANFAEQAKKFDEVELIMNIIPTSIADAFVKNDILQVLFFAVLFGFALSHLGERGKQMRDFIGQLSNVIFGIINIIMKAAPIGAFGAMAFVIGKYGIASLIPLGSLIGTFYLTALIFVLVVLGTVAALNGFSILRFISYIKEELLIVLGTSSSESALPGLMTKMENLGCAKSVVGLVVPTGYSFNLDGTNIYMTLAALFIAQATNTTLTWEQEATLLLVAMLTSKGASGVTGSGFIILGATIAAIPSIPIAGMAIILGIDKFMSECRALTNLVGNGVATVVVARWEKALDTKKLHDVLHQPSA